MDCARVVCTRIRASYQGRPVRKIVVLLAAQKSRKALRVEDRARQGCRFCEAATETVKCVADHTAPREPWPTVIDLVAWSAKLLFSYLLQRGGSVGLQRYVCACACIDTVTCAQVRYNWPKRTHSAENMLRVQMANPSGTPTEPPTITPGWSRLASTAVRLPTMLTSGSA